MSLPVNYAGPSTTTARRYLWRAQWERDRTSDRGAVDAFYERRRPEFVTQPRVPPQIEGITGR